MDRYFVVRSREFKEFMYITHREKEAIYNEYAIFPNKKEALEFIKSYTRTRDKLNRFRKIYELVELKLAPQFIREVEW